MTAWRFRIFDLHHAANAPSDRESQAVPSAACRAIKRGARHLRHATRNLRICQNPSTVLVVFIFVYLGFEHSIANMGTFSMAILGGGALTVNEALHNLLYSTVGNIVGGVLLVGLPFTYLNPREREEQMQEVA